MNRIVTSWKSHAVRSAQNQGGSDTINFDGESFTLNEKDQKKKDIRNMPNPDCKIWINEGTVKELVFNAPDAKVQQVRIMLERAFSRLGIKRFRGVQPFGRVRSYKGGRPNNTDIKRWTEALTTEDKYKDDLEFAKRLYVTILNLEKEKEEEF